MVYRFTIVKTSVTFCIGHQLRSCDDYRECDHLLVTADTRVATAYILNRVEDGEYGVAIAYGSILIIVMMAIILFFDWIVGDTRISRSKAKK